MCKNTDVFLIMPPFSDFAYPSLALSIFKAQLSRIGIAATVDYANVRFVSAIGTVNYKRLYHLAMKYHLAEVIFARLVEDRADQERVLAEFISKISAEYGKEDAKKLMGWTKDVMKAAADCVENTTMRAAESGARLVACASMFQQQNASLAILRRVKRMRGDVVTMLGGWNETKTAGAAVLKNFPFVDYVFFGEADEIFPDVCQSILNGENFELPYGLLRPGDPLPKELPHRLTRDLDALPYPDYDDYFDAIAREENLLRAFGCSSENIEKMPLILIAEGSRGCWWGEKHRCKFCGLGGGSEKYRQKSPRRIYDELLHLREKHGDYVVAFSDSIMSRQAQRELPLLLKNAPKKLRIFSEIKSNLTETDIKSLAEAGFVAFQPGIESLNDHVLTLMNKGNRAISHIAALKFFRQYGVRPIWNLLYGFPGECAADYEELLKILPLITHLEPPAGMMRIAYHRYSVYCDSPDEYGLQLSPSWFYSYYAKNDTEYIEDVAYVYKNTGSDQWSDAEPVYKKVSGQVAKWIRSYKGYVFGINMPDSLEMTVTKDAVDVADHRASRKQPTHHLTGLAREIYLACRAPARIDELRRKFGGYALSTIKKLKDERLIVVIGGEALSLATEGETIIKEKFRLWQE